MRKLLCLLPLLALAIASFGNAARAQSEDPNKLVSADRPEMSRYGAFYNMFYTKGLLDSAALQEANTQFSKLADQLREKLAGAYSLGEVIDDSDYDIRLKVTDELAAMVTYARYRHFLGKVGWIRPGNFRVIEDPMNEEKLSEAISEMFSGFGSAESGDIAGAIEMAASHAVFASGYKVKVLRVDVPYDADNAQNGKPGTVSFLELYDPTTREVTAIGVYPRGL
jgi:hypothetical protein